MFSSSQRFPSSHDDDDEGAFRPGEQRVGTAGRRGWADGCSLFRGACLLFFVRNRATKSKRRKRTLKQDLKGGGDKDRDREKERAEKETELEDKRERSNGGEPREDEAGRRGAASGIRDVWVRLCYCRHNERVVVG